MGTWMSYDSIRSQLQKGTLNGYSTDVRYSAPYRTAYV